MSDNINTAVADEIPTTQENTNNMQKMTDVPPENPANSEIQQSQQIILNPAANYTISMWNDNKLMTSAFKMAQMLASSNLIPQSYQGNPANCLIAIDIANRMNMPPLLVLQNLFIVQGRPVWSGQFCIAAINGCGKFEPLEFVYSGEASDLSLGCYAQAERRSNKKICQSDNVTLQMAKNEGWIDKKGSKWQTMPRQMMMYRSASFFARVYCPEVLMGLQTADEVQDVNGYEEKTVKTITLQK